MVRWGQVIPLMWCLLWTNLSAMFTFQWVVWCREATMKIRDQIHDHCTSSVWNMVYLCIKIHL